MSLSRGKLALTSLQCPLAQQKPVAVASSPLRVPALLPAQPHSSVLRGRGSELSGDSGQVGQVPTRSRSLSGAVSMGSTVKLKSELSTQVLGLYHIQGVYHTTE